MSPLQGLLEEIYRYAIIPREESVIYERPCPQKRQNDCHIYQRSHDTFPEVIDPGLPRQSRPTNYQFKLIQPAACRLATFSTTQSAEKHAQSAHKGERYLCPIPQCMVVFADKYYIEKHERLLSDVGHAAWSWPSSTAEIITWMALIYPATSAAIKSHIARSLHAVRVLPILACMSESDYGYKVIACE
ncbi:uncharacterized protein N7496_003263 [Penicillium cataractarum]|uniref:C2H2-type domain-containing protein n=1 Tax=Penicillium cataractarum TaxID=2100454 RepID=A0A9W9SMR6_9EURO|nr:uncharacterized protein N7496_003263 [Penicillium cataractarum]KAJ5380835.1 hypothetical protein N7496_003263 [Penicillium cataractarum]